MKNLYVIQIAAISVLLSFSAVASTETKRVMVHLFEWKWNDIKNECAYLEEKGYGAVQVSPPNEHKVDSANGFPWWQRYQPVSYQLGRSRSGTQQEFMDMVSSCWRDHGVKIYVDAVINHMAGGDGTGSAGTPYKGANDYLLYRDSNGNDVRYTANDFHSNCKINWDPEHPNRVSADEIRKCWVAGGGLPDLITEDSSQHRVKDHIIHFLNSMIEMGVAGFRFDASKHMHPADLIFITENLKNLRNDPGWFASNTRPFIFQEVIGGGPKEDVRPDEYDNVTRFNNSLHVTEFDYGRKMGEKFRFDRANGSLSDFLDDNFPVARAGWGLLDSAHAVTFIDNHDNQRGHGNGQFTQAGNNNSIGTIITHYYDGAIYNLANVFMLAWPYGTPKVMSSYRWPRNVGFDQEGKLKDLNDGMGPPSDNQGNTQGVNCEGAWVCEHRWASIAGMVGFNNHTQDAWNIGNKWHNGRDAIAFARTALNGESRGFVVINREGSPLGEFLKTGLPEGEYCDVARGSFNFVTQSCNGPSVVVDANGFARFQLDGMQASAIHVGAPAARPNPPPSPRPSPPPTQTESKKVSFRCDNGWTVMGESIYIVGGTQALGVWSIASVAQKLDPTDWPTWTGEISVPAQQEIEYKCVKARESSLEILQWEAANQRLAIGQTQARSGF